MRLLAALMQDLRETRKKGPLPETALHDELKKLTDGKVPDDMLSEVKGPTGRARTKALAALMSVGLVHGQAERGACPKCESAPPGLDGLWMHDYLQWSESRSEAQARRQSVFWTSWPSALRRALCLQSA